MSSHESAGVSLLLNANILLSNFDCNLYISNSMLPKLVLPARPDFLIVDHNLGILNQQCKTIAGVFKVFKTPPFLLFLCSPCWVSFELGWESLLSHLDLSGRALPLSASNLASSHLLDHNGRVVLLVSTPGAHLPTPLVHLPSFKISSNTTYFLFWTKEPFPVGNRH